MLSTGLTFQPVAEGTTPQGQWPCRLVVAGGLAAVEDRLGGTYIYSEADNLTANQAGNKLVFGITKNFGILD